MDRTGTTVQIDVSSSGVVFNEGSADFDFRVESNNNSNMLYVDGGNDRVAIGTNTQSAVLTIESAGNGYSTGAIAIKGAGVSNTSFITSANGTFFISQAGTSDDFVLKSNELVINEGSVDRDFRVESDSKTHMLFVDAGNNRVGIGEASPDTPLHLTTSSSGTAVTIESTGGNSASGPDLVLYRNSPSPLANDALASIKFRGEDSSGATNDYAQIISSLVDPTAGSEDGLMTLQTIVAGTNRNRLTVNSTELNINESGLDSDFRVESDTLTHALFVDAGNNTVNIARSSGPAALNVQADSGADGIAIYGRSSDNISQITMYNSGGTGLSQLQTRPQYFDIKSLADVPVIISPNASGRFFVYSGETVVNENSVDHDFRVESDSNTHALYVDAQYSVVGINSSDATTYTTSNSLVINGRDTALVNGVSAGSNLQNFRFWNNTGTAYEVAKWVTNVGAGQVNRAEHSFQVNNGAGLREWLSVDYGGNVVFNDDSHDMDFRVESDSNTHALVVDASSNLVSVGSSGGYGNLHVVGDNAASEYRTFFVSSASDITRGVAIAYDYANDYGVITAVDAGTGWKPLLVKNTNFNIDQGAVVNNVGGDYDFRVESDSNAHMLFVDAGANHVNIGTTSDFGGVLNVNGGAVFDDATTLDPDTMGNGRLGIGQIADGGGFTAPGFCIAGTGGDTAAIVGASGNMFLGVGDGVNANSLKTRLLLNAGEAVFNDESLNTDFRVESDGNTHALFVDAGNNRVGIGDSSPDVAFSVVSTGSNEQFHFQSPTPGMKFIDSNLTTRCFTIGGENGSVSIHADPNNAAGSSNILLRADGSTIAQFDSAGLKFFGDTATANALDDYEEGTWVATAVSGCTGLSSSTTNNRYTKVGNVVHVIGEIGSFTGTNSSNLEIGGLPFGVGNGRESSFSLLYTNINLDSGYTQAVGYAFPNASKIRIYEVGDSVSYNPIRGDQIASGSFIFQMTYLAT